MTSLTNGTLDVLRGRDVLLPAYDRAQVQTGIVHFGAGAFHRAHQASYFDTALNWDLRWGICEVALHSAGVRDALAQQDWLYSLAILDSQASLRVIGCITEILVAPESPAAVLARLVQPSVHLVTITITEKGYCLSAGGGLDFSHPDIEHDLRHPGTPRTIIGYLAEGLRLRRAAGIAPPTVLSCDNLADNGKRLRRAVLEFTQRLDAGLSSWIESTVRFPCSMVDSITPATDDALRARIVEQLGVTDRWPIQRELFSQWVIEDAMSGPQPDWAALGVTITNDVAGYERAKLRLLNGAHSSLGYLGSLVGYETVSQAMTDRTLAAFLHRLMQHDIAPSLSLPRGLDLNRYIETILQRFANPFIRYLLSQLAWDGSQKLPFRLLGTISDNLAAGRRVDRLCIPVAAWFHFVRRRTLSGERIIDPLAQRLSDIARACTGDPVHDVHLFLSLETMFAANLHDSQSLTPALIKAYEQLAGVDSPAHLEAVLKD
ncbi:MAG TPA: mannitol dehydrogenase family protein [Steroidobacteraceae bacterium]|jgi:fructuronate reductase